MQRIARVGLARHLDELLGDRPRWWQELARGDTRERRERPIGEDDEQASAPERGDPSSRKSAAVHRACHGIARVSCQPRTAVMSPPTLATETMPTTIIAGKRSRPA